MLHEDILFFLAILDLINLSICSIGPGLYRAIIAAISEMLEGFESFIYFLIPADSS